MASSLRLVSCCPSPKSPYLFSKHRAQINKLSSLHKPLSHRFSLSCSLSHHLPHYIRTCSFPLTNNKLSQFFLRFSSATQDPVINTDSQLKSGEQEEDDEEEEFSNTRLLATNVPWNCTAEDIRALFHKFGTVVDVELSMYNKTRNRGLAFVTMGSPEEALAALKNLESYEFEGRTLKMNYAKAKRRKPPPPEPPKPKPTFNLFLANLPYEARAKDLKEFFIAEGANAVSAEIIFHDNPRRSAGYGFVAFKTKKEADEALSVFNEKVFMGRPLRVARSKQFVKPQKEDGSQSDGASAELESEEEQAGTTNEN